MEVLISRATEQDISLLTSLGRITFEQTFARDNTVADMQLYLLQNFNETQIKDELTDQGTTCLVAYVDGEPAGYAKMKVNAIPPGVSSTTALEIERFYALQQYIGKKIGKALMEYCIAFAKNHDYEVMWLGVWEKNSQAIAFYEKWGFKVFGNHLFMLGTDAQTDLLMVKKLRCT